VLSICIPHYNFINPLLLKALELQCLQLNINFEIIIADDCSKAENKNYLQEFGDTKNFRVIYLAQNIGRSKIRNLLIKSSKYDLLLFLDGDSTIKSDDFIEQYLNAIKQNDLIYGGRVYGNLPNNNFKLHWLYGTKTESIAGENFHSNNFLVKKNVVDIILFDEDLTTYGYEDAVFGVRVSLKGVKIQRIDNPVIHAQLKNNRQFLNDTDSALKNISYLHHQKPELLPHLNLSILNFYLKSKKWGFHHLLNLTEPLILNYLQKKLIHNTILFPLKALMLYKLYVLNKVISSDYK